MTSQRPPDSIRPPRRPLSAVIALKNTLAVEPAFWRRHIWTSLRLAREAQRRGAMQKVGELTPLLALLAPRTPATVVEIGTYRGGTLYALCRVADEHATLISVDLPGGLFGGGYTHDELTEIRGYGLPTQSLHFLAADSHDAATRDAVVDCLGGRPIEFLFIDGDHRYDGVRRDLELYSPLVAPGGVIALHDILPHPAAPLCQVDALWNEVKDDYRHFEFIDAGEDWGAGQWGGIGILFV